eukprot:7102718-Pyramimonas_sp.AAC.1
MHRDSLRVGNISTPERTCQFSPDIQENRLHVITLSHSSDRPTSPARARIPSGSIVEPKAQIATQSSQTGMGDARQDAAKHAPGARPPRKRFVETRARALESMPGE